MGILKNIFRKPPDGGKIMPKGIRPQGLAIGARVLITHRIIRRRFSPRWKFGKGWLTVGREGVYFERALPPPASQNTGLESRTPSMKKPRRRSASEKSRP